jgi:hypothetical protein
MDAAILIRDMEPFRQAHPLWDRAAGLLLRAGITGAADDIAEATRLHVALNHDNWLRS